MFLHSRRLQERQKMKYQNAANLLPAQLLREVQAYTDGELLYIPKATPKEGWGTASGSRSYYLERNQEICEQHRCGASVSALARQYHLSVSTIKKIVYC